MPVYRYCLLRASIVFVVACCTSLQDPFVNTSVRALDISNGKKRLDRRAAIAGSAALLSFPFSQPPLSNAVEPRNNKSGNNVYPSLQVVTDPETYSALSYAPPNNANNTPLIVVLHGAGKNDKDILQDLGDPLGEHAGLIPSLIASGSAPSNLLDNFCVLAPYSSGKASFYNDPRRNLLQFVEWAIANQNTEWLPLRFDPEKIVLFGFSDGATVAIELLTTRRFSAGVICSYGYSGMSLPAQALERLTNLPIWVFHSRDDVIFDVGNSDRLVQQLKRANTNNGGSANNDASSRIKYSRFDSDPENLPPRVRGHSMGITASKSTELYDWMMEQVN